MPLTHLFVCREYPPAPYPPGGIGTYVRHITHLLARAGETVHVIAHRWNGAPHAREESIDGRLIVHRLALDEPVFAQPPPAAAGPGASRWQRELPRALLASSFPSQTFAWQAALWAEHLVESQGIDVIEAQEWEAPLYYFQLRRQLNLGPARRPPCIVHVHSPSEQIFEANGWETTVVDYAPAVSQEEYSITAADALLCPSAFVAEQILTRYRLHQSKVSVIPYPLGDTARLVRSSEIWSAGSICHIGRLEPRKGVLEWADALASIADTHPDLEMEFVGSDTPLAVTGGATVAEAIRARVPRRVWRQLRFHGNSDRRGLMAVLSRSWAAVVPSRWENFPYSCIESMASGLPVIASPNGGMRELIVDGESGWIAPDATARGLAKALARTLDTPAAARERMGTAAVQAVRRLCDNEVVVSRHLELKRQLARAHTSRSIPQVSSAARRSVGVIVVQRGDESAGHAQAAAAELLASTDEPPSAVAFVDTRLRLDPGFLSTCADLFAQNDRLGIVSAWTHQADPHDRIHIQPAPAVPYIWRGNEVAPFVAVRAEALKSVWRRPSIALNGESPRATFDRILEDGWTAVTYPAVLGTIELRSNGAPESPTPVRYSSMARAVQRLHMPLLQLIAASSPAGRRALVRHAVIHPARSVQWLAGRMLNGLRTPSKVAEPARSSLKQLTNPLAANPAPLVSVVIGVFNGAKFIRETCVSVLNQTYSPLELIVVDDGSTDGTGDIVRALAESDPRVRLIRQENLGVAAARNCGIAAASGEFIAPLDADDIWDPTKIERQVRRLQECGPETAMAYCWWAWINVRGQVLDRSPHWNIEGNVLQRLVEVNFTGNASVPLYRRSCVEKLGGYNVRLREHASQGCEDWDLALRIAERYKVAVVSQVLVGYRRRTDAMSTDYESMWRSQSQVMAALAARQPSLTPAALKRSSGQFALHLAGVAFWSRNYVEACRWALRARPLTLGLAVMPHVVRILARRLLGLEPAFPNLSAGNGQFRHLPRPLIPYDRIYARHWRGRKEDPPRGGWAPS